MEPTADDRSASVDRAYLLRTIDDVSKILADPSIPEKAVEDLQAVIFNVLTAVTPPELGDLHSRRLVDITRASPEDLTTIANPAVRLLKRRAEGSNDPKTNQFRPLLRDSEAYPSEQLGDFILDQNPYFDLTTEVLTDDQIRDARANDRLGGPFRFFNSFSTWAADKLGPSADFPRIPHPNDSAPSGVSGYQPPWYMLTGRTPKSLPNNIMNENDPPRSSVRNVVKTVEIEYGPEDGIDTGENLPSSTLPKMKKTHIFIMFAGGNGT
jgi:hypothetical protein